MTTNFLRRSRAVVALAAVLTLAAGFADARPGGGGSQGSRGSRTYSPPPATRTAPEAARPMERTQTPQPGPNMQRPTAPAGQVAQPRRPGLGTGFFAGLLGAGLLGALLGNGFLGGLAGVASMIGFLLQLMLIGGLIWLALRFFRRRTEPALAGAGAGRMQRSGLGGMASPLGGGAGRAAQPQPSGPRDEIGIGPADLAGFERTLVGVHAAYSSEDVGTLWTLCTPEMAGYFQEEINDNARRGVVNKVSDVRLLQGDLAEAWREGPVDYATAAMRYALTDVMVDKATGRVVSGNPRPTEVVELWTFRRDNGGPWKLSAIQQTG